MIDAAEREVPGIIAKHCQKPMITAFLIDTSFSSVMVELTNHLSTNNKIIPPKIKTQEITT